MNTTKKITYPKGVEIVGSVIIEDSEGKILLVKSDKWGGKWSMPGGHIEPGETIKEALSREVEEEIGIKIKPGKIVSYGELINSKDFHRQAHFIYFDIVGTIESGEIKLDNIELNEYRWVDPNECLSLDLAETYDITIKEYIKYKLATKIKEH